MRLVGCVGVVFVLLCVACSDGGPTPDSSSNSVFSSLDPDFEVVSQISMELALLGVHVEAKRTFECTGADALGSLNPSADPLLQVGGEFQVLCDVLKRATAEKMAVFSIVKETGAVPSDLLTFSVFRLPYDLGEDANSSQISSLGAHTLSGKSSRTVSRPETVC